MTGNELSDSCKIEEFQDSLVLKNSIAGRYAMLDNRQGEVLIHDI